MAVDDRDRWEILDLITRYNVAFDTLDAVAWADTFTDDGEFVGDLGNPKGRDALIAHVERFATEADFAPFRHGQHWVTNQQIDVQGETATMTASYLYIVPGDDGPRIAMMGGYRDDLRRTPDGWRFVRRLSS